MGTVYTLPFVDVPSAMEGTHDLRYASSDVVAYVNAIRNNGIEVMHQEGGVRTEYWYMYTNYQGANVNFAFYMVSSPYIYGAYKAADVTDYFYIMQYNNVEAIITSYAAQTTVNTMRVAGRYSSPIQTTLDLYGNETLARAALATGAFPIKYSLTNVSLDSRTPTESPVGAVVRVYPVFTAGAGISDPQSAIQVLNNGVPVPFEYGNGVLSFIMPDPS